MHGKKTEKMSLLHFSAPIMIGYQVSPNKLESVCCFKDDEQKEYNQYLGYWPGIVKVPISSV